ncbi:MAG: response regulator transcription factor [Bacteroidota bacterium]|jgi:two-component system nitrate/nitrite response regulator NarL
MMTLLIADDSTEFRRRLASIITCLADIEVVGQAGDVADAIGEIERTKPDVVILDIHMRGGSGLDVLQAAKLAKPAPVIIMLTVSSESEYKGKCMAMGADYFFEKSNDLTKMMSTLTKLARKFKAHRPAGKRRQEV